MSGVGRAVVIGLLLIAAGLPVMTAEAATATVSIGDHLQPARLTVAAGTAVTWTNDDDERHRVRSRDGTTEFDSGNLEPGESYTVVFEVAGDHPYVDERDPDDVAYHGDISVTDDAPTDPDGGQAAGAGDTTGAGRASHDVAVLDRSFSPRSIDVEVGATVTWTNRSDREHTVTFNAGGGSGEFGRGGTFAHTFDAVGTFEYLCAIHPEMTGTVNVVGSGPSAQGVDDGPFGGGSEADVGPGDTTGGGDRGGTSSRQASGSGATGTVSIVELEFLPARLTVQTGGEVTWTNDGSAPHTVTGDGFDSGTMSPGGTFSYRFDTPGTHPYRCTLHPTMTGAVVVRSGDGDGTEVSRSPSSSSSGPVASETRAGAEGAGEVPAPDRDGSVGAVQPVSGTGQAPAGLAVSFVAGAAVGAAGMRLRR